VVKRVILAFNNMKKIGMHWLFSRYTIIVILWKIEVGRFSNAEVNQWLESHQVTGSARMEGNEGGNGVVHVEW